MPKQLTIWYCTDNCGPGDRYRNRCALHHGIALEHANLDQFNDGRAAIYYNGYCPAMGGQRENTLQKARRHGQ